MEAARPRGHRRRERRGTVDRPLNTRLVRVSAVVLIPAIFALLFSLSTTTPLPAPQLEPVFDGEAAAGLANELSTEFPARVPGTDEAESAARWYAETISALGLEVEEDVWTADLVDLGKVELRNLVTMVPGRSEEAVVLVAHRDNRGAGEQPGENASGTAALIELARGFAPSGAVAAPLPNRTLILVSTDAGAYGGAGAARFARTSPRAAQALAAVTLDGIGGGGRPRLSIAGDGSTSPARTLVRTASARLEEQVGRPPSLPSVPRQLVDLAVPYAAGDHAPFVTEEIPAISITTAGEAAGSALAEGRLNQLGRATEALLGSIDMSVGIAFQTPDAVFVGDRAASGWVVRLVLIVAIVPFVLGVLDLVARGRRRKLPFTPALRGLRTRLLVWSWAGVLLWVGGLTGALPTGDALPLPARSAFVVDANIAGLAVLALAFVVGWLVARRPLIPTANPSPEERLAGYTCAIAWLGVVAFAIALTRPFALPFVLPSLYAWLWLPLRARLWQRAAVYLVGLLGPLAGIVLLGAELDLAPARAALYLAGLTTVGYVPVLSVLLAIAWLAAAAQLAALAFGRYGPHAETAPLRWARPLQRG